MTIDSEQMDANIRSINSTEIGAILASSRRNKNISLQELSDSLRIPKMYLNIWKILILQIYQVLLMSPDIFAVIARLQV